MKIFGLEIRGIQQPEEKIAAAITELVSNDDDFISIRNSVQINAVWACIDIISSAVAASPLKLYQKTAKGRVEVKDNPLSALVKKPSSEVTGFNFFESLVINLMLYGNAYCEIMRNKSKIVGLALIPSDKVKTERNSDDLIIHKVQTKDGQKIGTSKNMLHIMGKSYDGVTGMSPVKTCMESIVMAHITEKFGINYFKKGARPSGFLKTASKISKDTADRLIRDFSDKYTGSNNSGKIILLENGLDFTGAQNGNDQSQFLETRKFQIEEIARIFQVPLFLLQSTEKSTTWGSGLEQLNISFVQHALTPYLERIEQSFNNLLGEKENQDYYFKFNVDQLLRGDQAARYNAYHLAIMDGWKSINEVRETEDLPRIEGGDIYIRPLNTEIYTKGE